MGGVMRVPPEGEARANLHVGGRAVKTELTARERDICAAIGPTLRAQGLVFVGIDVIGDWMTEINVTSPTGIQEIARLDGVDDRAKDLGRDRSPARRPRRPPPGVTAGAGQSRSDLAVSPGLNLHANSEKGFSMDAIVEHKSAISLCEADRRTSGERRGCEGPAPNSLRLTICGLEELPGHCTPESVPG